MIARLIARLIILGYKYSYSWVVIPLPIGSELVVPGSPRSFVGRGTEPG
jgi:hypothetical protein